ncbi:MAG TPA: GNAT family N-acetyltransferase [Roseateles sp.]|nr:GNAT family N-acetyltransferase [Roseateles sp.]
MPELSFEPVVPGDFEPMLELRIAALRESLERLGRFDPQRARERLQAGFAPEYMQHICVDGERIGYVTLRPAADLLRLEHLYVRPGQQGRGVGAWVMDWVKRVAGQRRQDVTLSALKFSDANRFYLRHGFEVVGESDFDIDYRWKAPQA